jgi:hypothetical protein
MFLCYVAETRVGEVDESQHVAMTADMPLSPPLWRIHAETAQQQAEEQAKLRLAELAERQKAEEQRQKEAEAEAMKAAVPKAAPKKASVKKAAGPKPAEESKALVEEAVKAFNENHVKFDFEVKVESARNLRDADYLTGTSDPYCTIESLGASKLKFRTKTVNDKENPVWNQKVKMSLELHENIKFTIKDQDVGKSDDLLGWVEVPFKDIAGKGFDGELKLHDASDTPLPRDAFLKLTIKFVGSHAEAPAPSAKAAAGAAPKAAAKSKA